MSLRPHRFEEILSARLDETYRLRQSPFTGRWCVEQKAKRGVFDLPEVSDDLIRQRDGYHLVLEFAPDPFRVCDECHLLVPLPVMEIAEVSCDYCVRQGRTKQTWFDGWFPLSERTIEYLEASAPKRGKERRREIAERNAARRAAERRFRANLIEAIGLEYRNRLAGNLQIGYTGAGTPHSYGDA